MSLARLTTHWSLFCAAALLAACGGGNGQPAATPAATPIPAPPPAPTPAPPAGPPPAAATTLVSSVSLLSLKAAGAARTVTVVNTGVHPALDVGLSAGAALPPGSTSSPASCGTLAPGAACVITITPGATPSAARGAAPLPANLNIEGSNTNTVTVDLHVLDFGSVFQGGYVFDMDDSTPTSGGIGGKVAALSDAGTSVQWATDSSGVPAQTVVPGTNYLDGQANTAAMLAVLPASPGNHAAGVCHAYTGSGYADWYLPALCELGVGPFRGCGTEVAPTLPNLQTNLLLLGDTGSLRGHYWSSSEESGTVFAWVQYFNPVASTQFANDKAGVVINVRCVRALTP